MSKVFKPLSEVAQRALDFIIAEDRPLTLLDIQDAGIPATASHLTSLVNRGFIGAEKVTKEVQVMSKRTINVYSPIND